VNARSHATGAIAVSILLGLGVAAQVAAADAGATVFENNCAPCHGLDGKARTPAGKKLGAKDLSGSTLADADIAKQIRDGSKDKNGKEKMPPFKEKLGAAEISAVVEYVKTFRPH
jgi:mono/diheme cytochrome c family protein